MYRLFSFPGSAWERTEYTLHQQQTSLLFYLPTPLSWRISRMASTPGKMPYTHVFPKQKLIDNPAGKPKNYERTGPI
jgi:hypothetical protein